MRNVSNITKVIAATVFSVVLASMVQGDATPTIDQVYAAIKAGHLDQAQAMMAQVLKAHPESSKAHYVEAQILAAKHDDAGAQHEIEAAERLSPGLPFAKPAAVAILKQRISHASAMAGPAPGATSETSSLWLPALLLIAAVILVMAFLRRRQTPFMSPAAPGVLASTTATGTGGGFGSSLASGIGTGIGVGAGIVAGEVLANELLGRHHSAGDAASAFTGTTTEPGSDFGGQDFGINSSDADSWGGSGSSDAGGDGGW